jgi:hypothetical protein
MYPRLRVLGPAVCCVLAILSTPAAAATRTAADPRPQALWQAYPLTAGHEGAPSGAAGAPATRPVASTLPIGTTTAASGGPSARKLLVVVAAVVLGIVLGLIPALVIGAVVGVIPWPRRLRRRPVRSAPAATQPPALELPDDDGEAPDAELYFGGQRYRVEDLRRTISARLATERDGR